MRSAHIYVLSSVLLVAFAAGCNRRGGTGRIDRPRDAGPIDLDGSVEETPPGRDGGGFDSGDPECTGEGLAICGKSCVNLYSDARNCGACFNTCEMGAYCDGGTCVGEPPPECIEPYAMCEGACVDISSSPANCGACFNSCPMGTFCSDYECVSTCTPSCSGRECGSNGCGGSCGSCGSGETCSASGICTTTCGSGQLLCSGVCRTIASDPSNCGGCAISCSVGWSCVSGACTPPVSTSGDTCTSPLDFPAAGGSRTFTFTGRSANHTPFTCGTSTATPDIVYRWTPSRSGTATFRAAGPTSATDTMLSVFSSSSCTSTYAIACNDDEVSGVYSSMTTASVTAFSTYYVVVAPYSSTTDTITLSITSP